MNTDKIAKAALAEVLASPKWSNMMGLDESTIYGDLAIDVATKAVEMATKTPPRAYAPPLQDGYVYRLNDAGDGFEPVLFFDPERDA